LVAQLVASCRHSWPAAFRLVARHRCNPVRAGNAIRPGTARHEKAPNDDFLRLQFRSVHRSDGRSSGALRGAGLDGPVVMLNLEVPQASELPPQDLPTRRARVPLSHTSPVATSLLALLDGWLASGPKEFL